MILKVVELNEERVAQGRDVGDGVFTSERQVRLEYRTEN